MASETWQVKLHNCMYSLFTYTEPSIALWMQSSRSQASHFKNKVRNQRYGDKSSTHPKKLTANVWKQWTIKVLRAWFAACRRRRRRRSFQHGRWQNICAEISDGLKCRGQSADWWATSTRDTVAVAMAAAGLVLVLLRPSASGPPLGLANMHFNFAWDNFTASFVGIAVVCIWLAWQATSHHHLIYWLPHYFGKLIIQKYSGSKDRFDRFHPKILE